MTYLSKKRIQRYIIYNRLSSTTANIQVFDPVHQKYQLLILKYSRHVEKQT